MALHQVAFALALTALLAGCSAPSPGPATAQADAQDPAPEKEPGAQGLPPPDAAPHGYGTPRTQEFTQTWGGQIGQGEGSVYVLRSPDPVVDMPLNASAVLVEVRWAADHALPGEARLVVTGPQGDWGVAQGDGDLRLELPADVGGHQATLRVELQEVGSAAFGMRATYYVTSFTGGPADPAFTALP